MTATTKRYILTWLPAPLTSNRYTCRFSTQGEYSLTKAHDRHYYDHYEYVYKRSISSHQQVTPYNAMLGIKFREKKNKMHPFTYIWTGLCIKAHSHVIATHTHALRYGPFWQRFTTSINHSFLVIIHKTHTPHLHTNCLISPGPTATVQ